MDFKKFLLKEIKEWIEAIVVVGIIYFIILPFIFGTQNPIMIIASCSEYPYLTIGDIIFIKKAAISDINIPTVYLNNTLNIVPVFKGNSLEKLIINGKVYERNNSNPIVAYKKCFNGNGCYDIIHRAFLKIVKNNKTYLLTWGDNNPFPDQYDPILNRLCLDKKTENCLSKGITDENLKGVKIFPTIPYLGQIKLFFCDITKLCPGHSNIGTGGKYETTCKKRVYS